MIEIRIHGRGGQGAVTAAELLAISAFFDGKWSQAFPKFGPERSGAPVEAYCRIDERFINLRTQVYDPTHIIVLDRSLNIADIMAGLMKDGIIVINSKSNSGIKGYKTYNIDATSLALEILGKPIVNTAMLGAFSKATELVKLKSIERAIEDRFPKELAQKNIALVRAAYDELKI
jgi:pyruvate ferredoxin oxidoreductase gamma subunit